MERHFNQLQHQYRVLTSTWTLAVFAATGFILINEGLALGVPKDLAITGLTVCGATGITLLWLLDRRVYGMLLRACFTVALDLEKCYPWSPPDRAWLPPVRDRMLTSMGPRGATPYIAGFYVTANAVVLALGGLFLGLWSYRESGLGWQEASAIIGAYGVLMILWCLILSRSPHVPHQRKCPETTPTTPTSSSGA
jgi:hypothetical protein